MVTAADLLRNSAGYMAQYIGRNHESIGFISDLDHQAICRHERDAQLIPADTDRIGHNVFLDALNKARDCGIVSLDATPMPREALGHVIPASVPDMLASLQARKNDVSHG